MAPFAMSRLEDKELIRSFLRQDENFCAYALGDLQLPYSNSARWFAASRDGSISGLAMIYDALSPHVLFLEGGTEALSALLLYGLGPDTIFFTARRELEPILADFYSISQIYYMHRMRVAKGIFNPASFVHEEIETIQSVTKADVTAIEALIHGCADYDDRDQRDIAFSSEMLSDGTYKGVWKDGQLVALAGTHLVAKEESVAAIGNVMVRPDLRRQRLGTLLTQSVTNELILSGYQLIVLNVRQDNQAALKTYRRLGFKVVGDYIEGVATRR
jgi:RimJ/RimL family protein N-acetyltransferase